MKELKIALISPTQPELDIINKIQDVLAEKDIKIIVVDDEKAIHDSTEQFIKHFTNILKVEVPIVEKRQKKNWQRKNY